MSTRRLELAYRETLLRTLQSDLGAGLYKCLYNSSDVFLVRYLHSRNYVDAIFFRF